MKYLMMIMLLASANSYAKQDNYSGAHGEAGNPDGIVASKVAKKPVIGSKVGAKVSAAADCPAGTCYRDDLSRCGPCKSGDNDFHQQ